MPGVVLFGIVLAGLVLTLRAQVRPLRRHRDLLDLLALVPEWRFYALASIRTASDLASDIHLVIRDRTPGGETGDWRPVLWPPARRLRHGLWNPDRRVAGELLSIAEQAAGTWGTAPVADVQHAVPYLMLARRCLRTPPERPDMVARQFAIVRTAGRGARDLSVDFVSAWHRW